MTTENNGPGQQQGQNKNKGDKAYADVNSEKSRNYKEGRNSVNGPNWDKKSKGVEGDSGQNAGVFK